MKPAWAWRPSSARPPTKPNKRTDSMPSRLAVVLVNWNGWRDTIECLESLLPTLPDDARVLVCDNASSDDSLRPLADWAKHRAAGPAAFARYDRAHAERGGQAQDPQLVLIDTG